MRTNKNLKNIWGGGAELAFTLAEVLITLGVIGVVAALTLPTLIQNHKKVSIAAKLKKFSSTMEQAILAEKAENPDIQNWLANYNIDANFKEWFDAHLKRHLNILNSTHYNKYYTKVAFADGSGFVAYIPSGATSTSQTSPTAYFFYCTEIRYCKEQKYDGKTTFLFSLCGDGKFIPGTCGAYYNVTNREAILNSCKYGNHDSTTSHVDARHACARLIQFDGWEIKSDYPWMQTILK